MKKLEHKILTFFDDKRIGDFISFFNSLKNVYDDFIVYSFVPLSTKDKLTKLIKDEKLIVFPINTSQEKFLNKFGKKSMPNHIDSVMTFGRLLIPNLSEKLLIQNEKFIYLDVDMIISKEFPKKFLDSDKNIAFNQQPINNLEYWEACKNYREKIHAEKKCADKWFNDVSNGIFKKIDKRDYFNAGTIIINDIKSFSILIDRIVKKSFTEIKYTLFDDQDLLNFYNNGEIKVVDDQRMNQLVFLMKKYDDNTSIYHFAGNSKMKKIFNDVVSSKIDIKEINFNEYKSYDDLYNNLIIEKNIGNK